MKFYCFIFDIFALQRFGGVSKYIYEISKNIKSKRNIKLIKLPLFHYNENAKNYNFFIDTNSNILKKIIILINTLFKFFIKYFFYNYYFINSYFEIEKKNAVTIVYDLIPELIIPHSFSKSFLLKRKNTINNSNYIITISKNTKKDIENYFNINPSKIKIIYPGGFTKNFLRKNYKKKIKLNNAIPSNFYLYVGNRKEYKNFKIIMEASKILKKMNIDYKFVIYGGGEFNNEENFFLKKNNIEKYFIKVDGDNNFLYSLYSKAKCLIYPSKYEGFGIPIIEAFQSYCPVITTKMGSIPEVAKDAALYFDPDDAYDLIKKLELLDSYSKINVIKGFKISKKFDWETSRKSFAQLLKNLYE